MAALAHKISVSLPSNLVNFVKEYKHEHHLRSDSEVMALALKKFEKSYLEICYAESAKEMQENPILKEEAALWEKTTGDGIESGDW